MVGGKDQVAGGGLFFFKTQDKEGNPVKEIHLHGSSSDFGSPRFELFKKFEVNEQYEGYRIFWHGVDIMKNVDKEPLELTDSIVWGF